MPATLRSLALLALLGVSCVGRQDEAEPTYFPFRIEVREAGGRGVEGILVRVDGLDVGRTGAEGSLAFDVLGRPGEEIKIEFAATGHYAVVGAELPLPPSPEGRTVLSVPATDLGQEVLLQVRLDCQGRVAGACVGATVRVGDRAVGKTNEGGALDLVLTTVVAEEVHVEVDPADRTKPDLVRQRFVPKGTGDVLRISAEFEEPPEELRVEPPPPVPGEPSPDGRAELDAGAPPPADAPVPVEPEETDEPTRERCRSPFKIIRDESCASADLECLKRLKSSHGAHEQAQLQRAQCYMKMKNWAECAKIYDALARGRRANDVNVQLFGGICLFNAGRPTEAMDRLAMAEVLCEQQPAKDRARCLMSARDFRCYAAFRMWRRDRRNDALRGDACGLCDRARQIGEDQGDRKMAEAAGKRMAEMRCGGGR